MRKILILYWTETQTQEKTTTTTTVTVMRRMAATAAGAKTTTNDSHTAKLIMLQFDELFFFLSNETRQKSILPLFVSALLRREPEMIWECCSEYPTLWSVIRRRCRRAGAGGGRHRYMTMIRYFCPVFFLSIARQCRTGWKYACVCNVYLAPFLYEIFHQTI